MIKDTFVLKKLSAVLIVSLFVVGLLTALSGSSAAAACAALPTDRGTVTNTVAVSTAGTYRVWVRILTPDTTQDSVLLQIDDTLCNINVGGSNIPANSWTWVSYQNGNTASPITTSLTAGNHTITLAGNADNVSVDRVVLTQDTGCVPTGTGDNCANPPDTTPPLVSISVAGGNTSITTPATINATATDDTGISKLEFYVDGALKSTYTTPPFSYVLDPAGLNIGNHTVTAKAYDASGNSASSTALTMKVVDSVKPTVSLTSPAAGASLGGTASIAATAADNIAVSKVEFYVDGSLISTAATAPYTTSINTKDKPDGVHQLSAKAYDAVGNVTTTANVGVTFANPVTPPADTTAPVVSFSAPQANATISGTYSLAAVATDATAVAKVDFYVDGVLKSTDTSAPYSYSLVTTGLSNAAHQFKATAFDSAGNQASATVSATVNNATYAPEDINQDGTVNLLDFSLLSKDFNKPATTTTTPRSDINGDGSVNLLDFSRFVSKFKT